jgi:hypothetical protein
MSIPPPSGNGNAAGPTPSAPPPTQSTNPINRLKASWGDSSKRPMLIFGFAAVGVAVVLLLVSVLQLVAPAEPSDQVPTPTPTCVPPNCGVRQPDASIPQKLYVRDRTFEITPIAVPKNGNWTATANEGKVEWVFGSLVNYLVGLPGTQENKDLLQALSEADKITVEKSDGQTLEFKFGERKSVSPQNKEVFAQQRPGLTLVLLGPDGEERLVVTADYVVESEANKSVPSKTVAINTPIDIGPVRVKVLNARLVENAPGIPVGSAFYLVDFTVENMGNDTINVADFVFELRDYAGQKYRISDTASKLGPNPPPIGQLLPGLSSTFMSGFEVPSNITGPVLTWGFKPETSFNGQATVAVPLVGPTPTPDPRSQAHVQITQAYFSPDQTELIIAGGIGNPTNALVLVNPSDIVLSTPDGVLATLMRAEPALPWRIAPTDNVNFTLHFSRLPSSESILKILNNSFKLSF